MIVISCRRHLTDLTDHTNYMDMKHLAAIKPGDSVLVLVHGYRSDFDKTAEVYKFIEKRMHTLHPGAYNHVVGFFWPGSWSATIGFLAARRRTPTSGDFLGRLLSAIRYHTSGKVTVQSHSLGAAVIMHAQPYHDAKTVNQWVFTAPAIPNTSLRNTPFEFYKTRVLSSKKDLVLKYAYRLVPGNWCHPALGNTGPIDTNVEHINMSGLVEGHSGHRKVDAYYQHLI